MSGVRLSCSICALVLLSWIAMVRGVNAPLAQSPTGMSGVDVMTIPTPPETLANQSDPGEVGPAGPPFPGGAPAVPHGIRDFLPITLERNDCVECHAVEEKEEGEPTPIPVSHRTDLRAPEPSTGEDLVGARFNCVSCHVSLGGNPPLVANTFEDASASLR